MRQTQVGWGKGHPQAFYLSTNETSLAKQSGVDFIFLFQMTIIFPKRPRVNVLRLHRFSAVFKNSLFPVAPQCCPTVRREAPDWLSISVVLWARGCDWLPEAPVKGHLLRADGVAGFKCSGFTWKNGLGALLTNSDEQYSRPPSISPFPSITFHAKNANKTPHFPTSTLKNT